MSTDNLDDIDNQDFSEEIPKKEGSVIWHLVGQLKPGMSLSRVTLPTFILETRSTIERFTDWMAHADILRKIQNESDPCIRCLHLCTWIVSGFHMAPRTPKKPYNSLLGEVFRALLIGPDGSKYGTYVAEQVSHHPPISAFHYCDREGGAIIWGHSEMRSRFLGNSVVAQMDENTKVNLDLPNIGETYEFNFPNMYGRGIFLGRLVMEIGGKVQIKCKQSGVTATIDFLEKPYIFGRYNRFKGEIVREKKAQLTFEGRWSAFMRVNDHRNKKGPFLSFDVRNAVPLKFLVPPLNEQGEYESQNVWQYVTKYIKASDLDHATDHKFALEEKQRKERSYFEQNNLEWKPQCFYYSTKFERYIPNDLNLEPNIGKAAEEPTMPPPFKMPINIQAALDAGATRKMKEVHDEVEAQIGQK
ncbi:Oxysterol-binding protein [Tritrichomonas foetus]|uniref:Oxysterol-binding protein n=1 Tax=Tritrichomonas foetus TaxID=1144522 RepID=A0A1J4K4F1_9EUKA|nr:Oxysterol-binding protein [Tritrichomonas foetus]|eukprot:OHT06263.1 Oxysterol-binding protein [Tritrichomonas foetus]